MLIKRIGISIATGSLLLSAWVPAAFADLTVDISGNGSGSNNTVNVTHTSETVVEQANITKVYTGVDAKASTGGNTANGNTGGNVTVDTGNATNTVTVDVAGGNNTATVNPCECHPGNANITVSGNGESSTNTSDVTKTQSTLVGQFSKTKVKTRVRVRAKTGRNHADSNTDGTVGVTTGDAENTVGVTVASGHNTLNL